MLLDSHAHAAETAFEEKAGDAWAEDDGPAVLLVGRDPLLRSGLRLVLEQSGLSIAGEAASGDEAVELVLADRPSAVLVDMEGSSRPLEILRRLAHLGRREITLLALSETPGGAAIAEAVGAGASGYVLKEASAAELAAAIRASARGALVLPSTAAALLQAPAPRGDAPPCLTARERQVLGLIASGRGNGQIAAELLISPRTAKSHVSHILRKLQAENRTEAAVHAARIGLV
jgi:DNA-binding NarL/FixJ family response regulator